MAPHGYRLNGKDVASYFDYRITSFLTRLQRQTSSGCMIRLTIAVEAGGTAAAERHIATFASEALKQLLEPIP